MGNQIPRCTKGAEGQFLGGVSLGNSRQAVELPISCHLLMEDKALVLPKPQIEGWGQKASDLKLEILVNWFVAGTGKSPSCYWSESKDIQEQCKSAIMCPFD